MSQHLFRYKFNLANTNNQEVVILKGHKTQKIQLAAKNVVAKKNCTYFFNFSIICSYFIVAYWTHLLFFNFILSHFKYKTVANKVQWRTGLKIVPIGSMNKFNILWSRGNTFNKNRYWLRQLILLISVSVSKGRKDFNYQSSLQIYTLEGSKRKKFVQLVNISSK